MKAEKLFELLGNIDDHHIVAAQKSKRSSRKIAFVAAAVCLCTFVAMFLPAFLRKGSFGGLHDDAPPENTVTFNGAVYSVIGTDDKQLLAKYGLPETIDASVIGRHVGNGKNAENEEDTAFYLYNRPLPPGATDTAVVRPQRAVYVVKTDDGYGYALFGNFVLFDTDAHQEASEMFAVYGIQCKDDIAKIVANGTTYDDADTISSFYNALLNAQPFGNDGFQARVFGGLSEKEQQALSREIADCAVEISMYTARGLVTHDIFYHPNIGYIYWACNYYQIPTAEDQ